MLLLEEFFNAEIVTTEIFQSFVQLVRRMELY